MNAVGYGICHQLPERSLQYGGRILPVCARCAGMYLGFTACLIVLLIAYRGRAPRYPSWGKIVFLVLLLVPTALDAVTSYAGIRESGNAARMVTGSLAGTAIAALIFPLAAGALLKARRKDPALQEGRMLQSWWSAIALLAVPLFLSLAVWPDWPGAFWAWAPLVTVSIVFTLLALNFTLLTLLFEGLKAVERLTAPAWLVAIALLAVALELTVSNRLHWIVQRTL